MSWDAKIVVGAGLVVLLSVVAVIGSGALRDDTRSGLEPPPTGNATVPPMPLPEAEPPRVLSSAEAAVTFSVAGGLGVAAVAVGAAQARTRRWDPAAVQAVVVALAAASATTAGYITYETGRGGWWVIPAASTAAGLAALLAGHRTRW